jgi:hypothetical protein
LLGVDAKAHVQFIRDKERSSQENWKKKVDWLENFLENVREDRKHSKNWTLSAVDLNEE